MNCNWMGRRAAALVMGFLLLGTTIAPAGAQQSIGADDGRVVDIDANTVRIDGEDPVTVSGDWRRQGQVYDDAELRRVVINLGGSVDADRIWLNLAGDVLFGFDSSEVTPEAAAQLRQVAAVIRSRSVGEVHVIGHTDAKGSAEHNARLSRERASSVMRWLASQEHIPASVLVGRGAGAQYPVAANALPDGSDNPDGRARNRRVEIQFGTRAGVAITPGLGALAGGTITTNEARIDAGGISTGEARVDIGSGGVTITQNDAPARVAPVAAAAGGGSCQRLCELTAGARDVETVACFESTVEERGFDFDDDACDDLEDAIALGSGSEAGRLCRVCSQAEGFGEADCGAVVQACFPGR